jgi:hypothetical protein
MRGQLMSGAATLSLALACAALTAAPAEAALGKPVETRNGMVKGIPGSAPGVTEFRGIPFGAPPVGPLRWRAPQPVANWKGVRGDRPAGFAEGVGGLPQPERLHARLQGRPEASGDGVGLWRRL